MSESMIEVDELGNKVWRNSEGKIHCLTGPAVILENGEKWWVVNGNYHRLDGPAIEYPSGRIQWLKYGVRLGDNEEGFWKLWDTLNSEQKKNSNLLSYLPGDFHV